MKKIIYIFSAILFFYFISIFYNTSNASIPIYQSGSICVQSQGTCGIILVKVVLFGTSNNISQTCDGSPGNTCCVTGLAAGYYGVAYQITPGNYRCGFPDYIYCDGLNATIVTIDCTCTGQHKNSN